MGTYFKDLSASFLDKFSKPVLPPREHPGSDDSGFVLTGDSTIDRVVESIRQNMSVVLSGPRGCGKSYCVGQAIKRAEAQGLILPGAHVFLQGNREFPRDYLMEDAFVLRSDDKSGTIKPERRSAPLFKFAERDVDTGAPLVESTSRQVVMKSLKGRDGKAQPIKRFVLFLDEINRFSDGILDSLLTVLEERKAILAGDSYELPVVVLMTMNPPGYDGTARRLSPPLQARIGRSWRLYSPDLPTQMDILIRERLSMLLIEHTRQTGGADSVRELLSQQLGPRAEVIERQVELARKRLRWYKKDGVPLELDDVDGRSVRVWREDQSGPGESLTECRDQVRHDLQQLEAAFEEAMANALADEGAIVSRELARGAAIVCLCLWGVPSAGESAHTYLTEGTRHMLRGLAGEAPSLKAAMATIMRLCSYGPDGRAAPDWLQAAISLAQLGRKSESPVLVRHLRATAVDTLSHKLTDTFSPATEPEKEKRKHDAILRIFDEVFSLNRGNSMREYFDPLVESRSWQLRNRAKLWTKGEDDDVERESFVDLMQTAGLRSRAEQLQWSDEGAGRGVVERYSAAADLTEGDLTRILVDERLVVPADDSGEEAFSSDSWYTFFSGAACTPLFDGGLAKLMGEVYERLKEADPRPTIPEEVLDRYPDLLLFGPGPNTFEDFVKFSGGMVDWRNDATTRRRNELALADGFVRVWDEARGIRGDKYSEDWYTRVKIEQEQHGAVLPELKMLIKHQYACAAQAERATYKHRLLEKPFGRPFRPRGAVYLPGDILANPYLRGLKKLQQRLPERE